MSKVIKIGLLGSGTVGTGVVRVSRRMELILPRRLAQLWLSRRYWCVMLTKRPYLEDVELTDKAQEIVNDPEIDIVVELMGGLHPAFEYMMEAMKMASM